MDKVCGACGTRPVEWEQNENAYLGDIRYCEGCGRMEDERKNLEDGDDRGAHVGLLPEAIALARLEKGEGVPK